MVLGALQGLVAQRQGHAMGNFLLLEQTPDVAVFAAQQFDEAPAFDPVVELAEVTTGFAAG